MTNEILTAITNTMEFEQRLNDVQRRIEAACQRAKRSPDSVTLLAVTKGHPPDTVAAAVRSGVTLFGENKVQEAKAKIPLCPGRARWQMIGHLQSNKCRDAVHFFEMIQSVDSLELAREIDKCAGKAGKRMPVLIEVNIAGEASKFGYAPERLRSELAEINRFPRLEIQGLMTVPPWAADPEKPRASFRQLRGLKEECENLLGAPLLHLSMGMSGDFEIAIEEGATMIRLGTVLFGPRSPIARRRAAPGEMESDI